MFKNLSLFDKEVPIICIWLCKHSDVGHAEIIITSACVCLLIAKSGWKLWCSFEVHTEVGHTSPGLFAGYTGEQC